MNTYPTIKLLFTYFTASLLFTVSLTCAASIITNADIDSISVKAPNKWKAYNVDLLFDGIDYRYTTKRFAGYQKTGDLLSANDPFTLSVALINNANIESISFFNDWRNVLKQQVTSMSIALYNDDSRLLWSDSFSGLKKDSWDQIDLVKFDTPIFDVKTINFSVTGAQSNHFEIRELLVSTYSGQSNNNLATSNVSTPSIIALFTIGLGVFAYRKFSKR